MLYQTFIGKLPTWQSVNVDGLFFRVMNIMNITFFKESAINYCIRFSFNWCVHAFTQSISIYRSSYHKINCCRIAYIGVLKLFNICWSDSNTSMVLPWKWYSSNRHWCQIYHFQFLSTLSWADTIHQLQAINFKINLYHECKINQENNKDTA